MSENKNIPVSVDFEPFLLEDLKNPEFASGYLNEALSEYIFDGHVDSFNLAIKFVLKSQNVSQLSRETGISKQHIHRIITGKSKPTFDLLVKIFKYLGYQFELKPINKTA